MSAESTLCDGQPAGFGLIETFRWEPAAGFVRLEGHIARLERSAAALGFTLDRASIVERLNMAASGEATLRMRLELYRDGRLDVTAQPFQALPAQTVWRLAIAQIRVRADDPMLIHKTTLRGLYEQARAEFTHDEANEVILLNEKDEICEGTISNIFARFDDDILVTPPLSSGLLPGIFRQELLEYGEAVEGVLYPSDLQNARQLLIGNSLRGLIRAKLRR